VVINGGNIKVARASARCTDIMSRKECLSVGRRPTTGVQSAAVEKVSLCVQ